MILLVCASAFAQEDPPALPADDTNLKNGTTPKNNPAGKDVTTTAPATLTGGTVPSVITAGQGMQADPFNPGARAQWQQATTNALRANALLGKAAASGQYNTEKLDAQRMLWVLEMTRGLNGANSNASGGNKQRSAPQRQLANAQMAQPTTSQPNNNAQIVNIAGSASDPRVVVVSSTTSVNLRVSNPGTEPSGAAKFVLDNVGSGVSAINSGRDDGAALSPGGLFVSRFIDSLRDTAERYEAAEGTAPREKTENDSVRLDENAARNLPSSGVPASADLVESAQWTESKKEALKEFVKKKLEALAEGTTPEVLAKETEDSNFVAALKNAKRDPLGLSPKTGLIEASQFAG